MGLPSNLPDENKITLEKALEENNVDEFETKFPLDNIPGTTRKKTTNSHAYIIFPATLKGLSDAKKAMNIVKGAFRKQKAIPTATFHKNCMEEVEILEKQTNAQKSALDKFGSLKLDEGWVPLPSPARASDTASNASFKSSRSTVKADALHKCNECGEMTTHKLAECPLLLRKIRTHTKYATKICGYCKEPTQPNGHIANVCDWKTHKWHPMCPKLIAKLQREAACSPCNSSYSDA